MVNFIRFELLSCARGPEDVRGGGWGASGGGPDGRNRPNGDARIMVGFNCIILLTLKSVL